MVHSGETGIFEPRKTRRAKKIKDIVLVRLEPGSGKFPASVAVAQNSKECFTFAESVLSETRRSPLSPLCKGKEVQHHIAKVSELLEAEYVRSC